MSLVVADVTDTARKHNGLMVTVTGSGHIVFKHTEVTQNIGATEFVIKGGSTQRTVRHDRERTGDTTGFTVNLIAMFGLNRHILIRFPILGRIRQLQRRHCKTAKTGLRTSTATGSPFVTNFTARTGRSAREGRNRRGVVVRFNLKDRVRQFLFFGKDTTERFSFGCSGVQTRHFCAFENSCVIRVGHNGAVRMCLMRFANHAEKRFFFILTVDCPLGVKDFVAAVLGIGLGKHHEFDVCRITLGFRKGLGQIIDFVFTHGQTH